MSEIRGIDEGGPRASQLTSQLRGGIRDAIAQWKSQGVRDWEILDVWATLVYQQGDYAIADTLATAAYEIGKPVE